MACHPGCGEVRAGECCCRGCREMGAEPAILGSHQDDVIPSWDLEDRGWLHPGV